MNHSRASIRQFYQSLKPIIWLGVALLLHGCAQPEQATYVSHQVESGKIIVQAKQQAIEITPFPGDALEVHYLNPAEDLPSFAKKADLVVSQVTIDDQPKALVIFHGELKAVINKSDLSIDYYRGDIHLTKQMMFKPAGEMKSGFQFSLSETEKILGGGERILGMDRRGHRMPLYNRAHYGYTTESNQMYFSLPAVMSSKSYSIVYDNSASGVLDIGKTDSETLVFQSKGGRNAYIISTAPDFTELTKNYIAVTGHQPLPPRWALGNFASRFGYRSQQEVEQTVAKFEAADIPLDTIIIDLYWFGPDIKGHLGNLTWDKNAFPDPQGMIQRLKEKGIKTIVITEPFILTSSTQWQSAKANQVLAKDTAGEPYRFDFYFGNTGLVDVFDDKAQDWFWQYYETLLQQGIAGTWGDLGEPEVHPDDILHHFSGVGSSVRGDRLHNAYGHQWAKMIYQKQRQLQPNRRPFIMMRSGFAGSQRYGMIPWTGDVSRSWEGLKPQVELSLQMGLFGMGYTHSDLGGFAGGEAFDKELYIRWLQYGVFQPVYRPHGQDNIAPEPVFHDQETQAIVGKFIKLRYQMLPYLYTMAYQNTVDGTPLMRPRFYQSGLSSEQQLKLIENKTSYFWGDNILVSPIVSPGIDSQKIELPKGVWFDFWRDQTYQGNQAIDFPVTLETIPVLVKAGSFIPMVNEHNNTQDYSSEVLVLHYYFDPSVQQSEGKMYDDDGLSFDSIGKQQFELLTFQSKYENSDLVFSFKHNGGHYPGMPEKRKIKLIIHGWKQPVSDIYTNKKLLSENNYFHDTATNKLTVEFEWRNDDSRLLIKTQSQN